MPIYGWSGIDVYGKGHRGTLFAFSHDEVHALVDRRGIGCTSISCKKKFILSSSQRDTLLAQLASLVVAYVPVYEALIVIKSSQHEEDYKLFLEACIRHIAQGSLLSDIFEHAHVLDSLICALIRVGESTGTLGQILQEIVRYRLEEARFTEHMRQALTVPLLTLSFFVVMLIGMLVFVIPRFSTFFELYNVPLPFVTKILCVVSSSLTISRCLYACIGSMLIGGICQIGCSILLKQGATACIIYHIPCIRGIYRTYMQARTLKILGTLVKEQVPLSRALEICADMTKDMRYKHALHMMLSLINEGASLSSAWHGSCLSHEEIHSLLTLGESTGRLSHMLLHGAHMTEERLKKHMQMIILYLNPALLVISAGLIGMFLYGLYIPLITMSSSLG